MKEWLEASRKLLNWALALICTSFIFYMGATGVNIPAWMWAIYAPVMASVGIPIVWQGAKAIGISFGKD